MHVKNTYILKTSRVSRREDAQTLHYNKDMGAILYTVIVPESAPPSPDFVVVFAIILINVFGDLTLMDYKASYFVNQN